MHYRAGALALMLMAWTSVAAAATGRTSAAFAVSSTGAATYTIPIWAPPGPRGVQPHMALVYNSQRGNNFVGVGWGLSGLSSLYRCNLTFAQDAAPSPVTLTASDGLCLDGQRLRLTSGTYGSVSSTYQTEIANFSNVKASATAAGNGPAYFTVQRRDGLTYTYGNTTDSRVLASGSTTALSWQLNEVSDRAGNTMIISYDTATGAAVPDTLSWTPTVHGASTYSYTMKFAYSANVAPIQGYAAGTRVTNANLLGSVTIAYSGTTVKKYSLSYQASPTSGRDQLIKVQECADAAQTNCLQATQISYQNGTAGVSTTVTAALSKPVTFAHYDFNHDGYPDLMYANGTTYYVSFGSATGYGTGINTGISTSAAQVLPGNLLGTGKDGVLVASGTSWSYYSWNGSSFTNSSTGLSYDSTAAQYVLEDIDGDGKPDLISTYTFTVGMFGGTGIHIYSRLNMSSATAVSFATSTTNVFSIGSPVQTNAQISSNSDNATSLMQSFGGLRSFDFDGDGRQDLAVQVISKNSTMCSPCTYSGITYELTSNGTTLTSHSIASFSGTNFAPVGFLNFNSDGCTDYLTANTIFIAGCNGSTPAQLIVPAGTVIGAMDWNGDGQTDILVQNGSTVGVYLSTGSGLSSLISTSIPYSISDTYFPIDANGDGLDDLGYWNASATGYYLHNGKGLPADLVTSITDGYGNIVSTTYVPITQSNYSQSIDAPATYQNYIGPIYVVSIATFSDPTNPPSGTYNQKFTYNGGWMNVQGRGFAGFESYQMHDSRYVTNPLWQSMKFRLDFPYTGMLIGNTAAQDSANTQLISTLVNTPAVTHLSTTSNQEREFPYVSSSILNTYEVGGSKNTFQIVSTSNSYTFDNYGNPTDTTTVLTDEDAGSPYFGKTWTQAATNTFDVDGTNQTSDITNWCLPLLDKVVVTYSSSLAGSSSITRTRQYTPDTTTANCRYTSIITEPTSTSYKVTDDLTYDAFGNLQTDKVTGVNMTPSRTTTINWVATGQFPSNATDATGALTQFDYDYHYGLPSKLTDPNNLPTMWQYTDGFGRRNLETRADGTTTSWTYSACASDGGCLLGGQNLALDVVVKNTDATVQSTSTTYFDQLERPLISKSVMLASGTFARNEVRYDNRGNVLTQYVPCTWSSVTTTCTYSIVNAYDALNRLTSSTRPVSSATPTVFQTTSYDYEGRTTIASDPYGKTKTTVADVNGWYRQTKDNSGYAVTMAYDAAGSRTSIVDSLGNTLSTITYNYGLAAFPVASTDMDMGAWLYTVDALGEVTGWRDAKNQTFLATYDLLSRPVTRTELDLYTQWTWGSVPANHEMGHLISVCTGTGTSPTNCTNAPGYSETDTYDAFARPYKRIISIPSQPSTFTYTRNYNATTGLLDTFTYPVSTGTYALQVKYGYQNGLLKSVTDVSDTPNVAVWTANTTDPVGQVTQETLGNGIVTTRTYDAVTHWLGSVQSGVGGGATVKNLGFMYDEMGNLTQRQDNNLGLTENVFYDPLYRFDHSLLNGTQNLAITYDSMGNIASRSDISAGAAWTYDPARKHQVTQLGSSTYQYTYDANGNGTARPHTVDTWASYNYPVGLNNSATAESWAFEYGPDRQRWRQLYTSPAGTETTYYVGSLMDFVVVGSLLDYRHYIYAGNTPVAVYSVKSSGVKTFSYFIADHEGSIASITNSSGSQVVGENFAAFGARRDATTWTGLPNSTDLATMAGISRQGYTFQTVLGERSSINHMKGRIEDAFSGRFLSADPTVPDPANTQSYNRYSYVNNNPLTLTDPTGFADYFVPIDCSDSPCPDPDPANEQTITGHNSGDALSTAAQLANGVVTVGNTGSQGNEEAMQEVVVTGKKKPKPQGTLQNLKNWLCNAGNTLASNANKLSTAGLRIEVGGAAVSLVGLVGQPEVNPVAAVTVGVGVAATATGAAAGSLATLMQMTGGIAQMIGSNNIFVGDENLLAGSVSLLTGGLSGLATGGTSQSAQALVGASVDTAVAAVPGMDAQQAQCGGGN